MPENTLSVRPPHKTHTDVPTPHPTSPPSLPQDTEKEKYYSIWKHQRRAVRRAYETVSKSQEGGLTMHAYRKIVSLYDPGRSLQDVTLTFLMQDGTPIYSNRQEASKIRQSIYFDEDGQPTEVKAGDGRLALSELYRFFECSRLKWKIDYKRTIGRTNYEYLPTKFWPRWRLGGLHCGLHPPHALLLLLSSRRSSPAVRLPPSPRPASTC